MKRNCQTARHYYGKIVQNLRPARDKTWGRIEGPDRIFAQYSITNDPNASRDRIVYLPNIQSQTTKHPVGANLVFALFFQNTGDLHGVRPVFSEHGGYPVSGN
jgi:hypothetical protein